MTVFLRRTYQMIPLPWGSILRKVGGRAIGRNLKVPTKTKTPSNAYHPYCREFASKANAQDMNTQSRQVTFWIMFVWHALRPQCEDLNLFVLITKWSQWMDNLRIWLVLAFFVGTAIYVTCPPVVPQS